MRRLGVDVYVTRNRYPTSNPFELSIRHRQPKTQHDLTEEARATSKLSEDELRTLLGGTTSGRTTNFLVPLRPNMRRGLQTAPLFKVWLYHAACAGERIANIGRGSRPWCRVQAPISVF
jgi:hypothetical protein